MQSIPTSGPSAAGTGTIPLATAVAAPTPTDCVGITRLHVSTPVTTPWPLDGSAPPSIPTDLGRRRLEAYVATLGVVSPSSAGAAAAATSAAGADTTPPFHVQVHSSNGASAVIAAGSVATGPPSFPAAASSQSVPPNASMAPVFVVEGGHGSSGGTALPAAVIQTAQLPAELGVHLFGSTSGHHRAAFGTASTAGHAGTGKASTASGLFSLPAASWSFPASLPSTGTALATAVPRPHTEFDSESSGGATSIMQTVMGVSQPGDQPAVARGRLDSAPPRQTTPTATAGTSSAAAKLEHASTAGTQAGRARHPELVLRLRLGAPTSTTTGSGVYALHDRQPSLLSGDQCGVGSAAAASPSPWRQVAQLSADGGSAQRRFSDIVPLANDTDGPGYQVLGGAGANWRHDEGADSESAVGTQVLQVAADSAGRLTARQGLALTAVLSSCAASFTGAVTSGGVALPVVTVTASTGLGGTAAASTCCNDCDRDDAASGGGTTVTGTNKRHRRLGLGADVEAFESSNDPGGSQVQVQVDNREDSGPLSISSRDADLEDGLPLADAEQLEEWLRAVSS